MAMKRFVVGLGIGLAAGYLLRPQMEADKITPERALREVKKIMSQNHTISGSWIHMLPETIEKNNITYEVYRGGITTTEEDETVQHEFFVDAKTGTLLQLETI